VLVLVLVSLFRTASLIIPATMVHAIKYVILASWSTSALLSDLTTTRDLYSSSFTLIIFEGIFGIGAIATVLLSLSKCVRASYLDLDPTN
jgi:hypothetical protein